MRRLHIVFLAVLAAVPLGPAAAEEPVAQLAALAQGLRMRPAAEAYARLEQFADQHRGTEVGARAALVLGLTDFEKKNWSRAEQHFASAVGSQLLGDYARFFWAQAQRQRGAPEQALATLADFIERHPASRLAEAARIEQAAGLAEAGRAAEARTLLAQAPDAERRPGLLLALARAQAAAGDPEAAVENLHRIYYEFPLSPEAEPANQLLSELRPGLGGRYLQPSEGMRLRRAELFWAAQAYQGARSAFLDLSVRASDLTRRVARLRAAQAFLHSGGGARACAELEVIKEFDSELEAEARAYRAQCRLRADDPFGFEQELELLRARAASRWYAQALFLGGSAYLASDNLARARALFEELLERFPQSEWAAEAHWKLAWTHYLASEFDPAAQAMETHLERFPDSPFVPRALYWRARLAQRRGETELATRLGELLRAYYPRHYLGQQVAQPEWAQAHGGAGDGEEGGSGLPAWLEQVRLTRPAASIPPLPEGVGPLLERALALEQLGLIEFAMEEVKLALEKGFHPEAQLIRARLALALERPPEAIESVRRALPNAYGFGLEELPRSVWELLFPRLHWDLVQRYARTYRLDPYLVAALIHQESRYDPRAVSVAGALGLMQLMPDTARRLAGVRRLDPERLFEPEFNIRLGTRFLRQLMDRFGGQLELVVAAYNAGGTAVSRWHGRRTWSEPAEFVESIPAAQSREFVYIVLRNYQFYRDLYAPR